MATAEVKIKVLHGAVGSVNESDVQLAAASSAIIVGFNVLAEDRARSLASKRGVDVRYYQIIYELLDDVKRAMEAQLTPETQEKLLGRAQVRAIFRAGKTGNVAGCYVTNGIIKRSAFVRVLRKDRPVHDRARIESLRRFKDDVKEVRDGFECGIQVRGFNAFEEGDVIEAYELLEVARTLEDVAAAEAEQE
jgi:translation initiation factor IF-2